MHSKPPHTQHDSEAAGYTVETACSSLGRLVPEKGNFGPSFYTVLLWHPEDFRTWPLFWIANEALYYSLHYSKKEMLIRESEKSRCAAYAAVRTTIRQFNNGNQEGKQGFAGLIQNAFRFPNDIVDKFMLMIEDFKKVSEQKTEEKESGLSKGISPKVDLESEDFIAAVLLGCLLMKKIDLDKYEQFAGLKNGIASAECEKFYEKFCADCKDQQGKNLLRLLAECVAPPAKQQAVSEQKDDGGSKGKAILKSSQNGRFGGISIPSYDASYYAWLKGHGKNPSAEKSSGGKTSSTTALALGLVCLVLGIAAAFLAVAVFAGFGATILAGTFLAKLLLTMSAAHGVVAAIFSALCFALSGGFLYKIIKDWRCSKTLPSHAVSIPPSPSFVLFSPSALQPLAHVTARQGKESSVDPVAAPTACLGLSSGNTS